MALAPLRLETGLAQLYAQALVAVCRADHEIGLEVGPRLQQQLALRTGQAIALEDLLLSEPLDPGALGELVHTATGPFRGAGVHPGELGRMIVVDAIAVVLAKGYVSEAEARQIMRFASALGCTREDVGEMSGHLAPWLSGYR